MSVWIQQWSHLIWGFLGWEFWFLIQPPYSSLLCSEFLFLSASVLAGCTFLGIYPCSQHSPACLCILVHGVDLWSLVFLCFQLECVLFHFWFWIFTFWLGSLAKDLSILLIFSKLNHSHALLFFSTVSFTCALVFIVLFYLLSFGLACSFFHFEV